MGYISPITQYEYIQYTNRTIAAEKLTKNMISCFQPVQPIRFHRKNEERDSFDREINSDDFRGSSNRIYKNYVPTEIVKKTATEMTGVGQFINESI